MPERRTVLFLIHALLIACAVFWLIPFGYMLLSAFREGGDNGPALFEWTDGGLAVHWSRITLDNFRRLFAEPGILRALLNSVFYSSVTSLGATLAAAMGGYALSKFPFRGREPLTAVVLGALIIPAPLLIAPGYQWLYRLGLLDTYGGLLLPAIGSAFGVFLFRQSMLKSVPGELIEAARIDGAGEWRIFFGLVLPLVRPMVGAFLMIMFLGTWNNFINPQVVMQSPEMFPLSVAINNMRGLYGTDNGLIIAGSFVSVAPLLCLFLLLQREFISGLTSGAVKG
jgi:ABC-type glycerol-3-phosphate transport system permease component